MESIKYFFKNSLETLRMHAMYLNHNCPTFTPFGVPPPNIFFSGSYFLLVFLNN